MTPEDADQAIAATAALRHALLQHCGVVEGEEIWMEASSSTLQSPIEAE